jgi:RNA polymerase sigma factor (TIGR02999 family)
MSSPTPDEITHVLERAARGHSSAAAELLPLVYDELRRLAQSHMRRASPEHTLQATALVHEAYLKLVRSAPDGWQGRAHFFAVAATAMRQVLANHARDAKAAKRGGEERLRVTLSGELADERAARDFDALSLHETLARLAELDPVQYRVVELRTFAGLSVEEVAEVLAISTATVKREWRAARAWLAAELAERDDDADAASARTAH